MNDSEEILDAAIQALQDECKMLREQRDDLISSLMWAQKFYNRLRNAVVTKHPNETRHETALRYIQEAEARLSPPKAAALSRLSIEGDEK